MSPPTLVEPTIKVRRAPSRRWITGLLVGILLAFLIIAAIVWSFTGLGLLQLAKLFRSGQIHINTDQPTVVRQIQQLRRLESVSYSMDKIISGERNNPYFPQPLAGERLLLIVHGEVVAGVDLGKLQPGDLDVHGDEVAIRLPKAQIFSTRLDNAKTRVYSRDTGIFSVPDPDLESQVRQEAERQLQDAALADGILTTADQNARQTITGFLSGLGFKKVDVH